MKLFIKMPDLTKKDINYLERNGFATSNNWVNVSCLMHWWDLSNIENSVLAVHEALGVDSRITQYKIM